MTAEAGVGKWGWGGGGGGVRGDGGEKPSLFQ